VQGPLFSRNTGPEAKGRCRESQTVYVAEGYFDWNDNTGNSDFFTYQVFLAYSTEKTAVGLQYAHQTRQHIDDDPEELDLFSGFIRRKFSHKFGFVARVDRMFSPNSRAESQLYLPFYADAKSTLFIFALDFFPVKQVHFTPNVEIIMYDKNSNGFQPATDIIPRITFFYKFNWRSNKSSFLAFVWNLLRKPLRPLRITLKSQS